jgi:hypothetical protein
MRLSKQVISQKKAIENKEFLSSKFLQLGIFRQSQAKACVTGKTETERDARSFRVDVGAQKKAEADRALGLETPQRPSIPNS